MIAAQSWVDTFVQWYNTEHLYSQIRFVTPDDRHYGREEKILKTRREVYSEARHKNPDRWSGQTRNWQTIAVVRPNPEKIEPSEDAHLKKVA